MTVFSLFQSIVEGFLLSENREYGNEAHLGTGGNSGDPF